MDPSSSLDELELLGAGENPQAVKTAPVSNHRRARSSLGGQRKSSAKQDGKMQFEDANNRGALLSQKREKNSSSALDHHPARIQYSVNNSQE